MPFAPDGLPDLSPEVPRTVPDLKINSDLGHLVHGPHFDVITPVPGGVDKLRIGPTGEVIGSETQIGPIKMPWD